MDTTKNIAALFDFDGVVMDTETQYSVFWDELGRRYHPEIKDFGRVIKGQTLTQIYDKYFAGMDNIQKKITADLNNFEKGMLYEYTRRREFYERITCQWNKDSYSNKFE